MTTHCQQCGTTIYPLNDQGLCPICEDAFVGVREASRLTGMSPQGIRKKAARIGVGTVIAGTRFYTQHDLEALRDGTG